MNHKNTGVTTTLPRQTTIQGMYQRERYNSYVVRQEKRARLFQAVRPYLLSAVLIICLLLAMRADTVALSLGIIH
jgi:hypothetical protein